jgi:adenylate cyclase
MTASHIFLAAVSAVAVLASTAAWWTWRETQRLRERMERASTELEQLQQSFRRFAPGEVIEALIQGVPSAPERREVTVLVADLVGFTALSERLDPAVLVRVLNGYLDRMSQTITEHRGHVSKFLGDGILALFGALTPNPWHADDAVRAALAMRDAAAR